MRSALTLFLVTCLPCTASNSEEIDKGLAGCAAITNSVNRLSCYDELAVKRNVDKPRVKQETQGNWDVRSETSKIDDTTNVFLSVVSTNSVTDRIGREGNAHLLITCREKKTDLILFFNDNFMSDNGQYGEVTIRFDKDKARKIRTNESTDNMALGLWNGSGVGLIKSMFGKSRMLVRATPYNEAPITADFEIVGLASAIAPLRKACGW